MENLPQNIRGYISNFYSVCSFRYGVKVDIWSAGVISYVLLCGFLPFTGLELFVQDFVILCDVLKLESHIIYS